MSAEQYVIASVKNVKDFLAKRGLCLPSKCYTPLATNYHPELEVTPELKSDIIQTYQEYVGILRWLGCQTRAGWYITWDLLNVNISCNAQRMASASTGCSVILSCTQREKLRLIQCTPRSARKCSFNMTGMISIVTSVKRYTGTCLSHGETLCWHTVLSMRVMEVTNLRGARRPASWSFATGHPLSDLASGKTPWKQVLFEANSRPWRMLWSSLKDYHINWECLGYQLTMQQTSSVIMKLCTRTLHFQNRLRTKKPCRCISQMLRSCGGPDGEGGKGGYDNKFKRPLHKIVATATSWGASW